MQDYPNIVYKYRDWKNTNHKKMLCNNELYLASPADFNDPFDCRIPTNHLLLDTEEKKEAFITAQADFAFGNNKPVDFPDRLKSLKLRMQDMESFQKEGEELQFKMQDERFGVLALSDRWNSILMWSHYAFNHQGFCIGFHETKLRNSGLFGRGGMVVYSVDMPSIAPEATLTQEKAVIQVSTQTLIKSQEWTYEQEYRLAKTFFPDIPTKPEHRIVKIPDDFIAEVILGINCPDNHKQEILEECSKRNIPIYQAVKVPFKFLIDRVKL